MRREGEEISLDKLSGIYENKLESVFRCNSKSVISVTTASTMTGSAKAVSDAGTEPEIFVINNRTPDNIARSVESFAKAAAQSQKIFIPGGFSGGDEPAGSGKFITAFFRSSAVREQVGNLLGRRGGLMCGICNGFQALIKLGLLPYGRSHSLEGNAYGNIKFNPNGSVYASKESLRRTAGFSVKWDIRREWQRDFTKTFPATTILKCSRLR